MKDMTERFANLTEIIYSAGMEQECEELQEIWNHLVSKIKVLTQDIEMLESTVSELEEKLAQVSE
jgi:prefoldin subunit 5